MNKKICITAIIVCILLGLTGAAIYILTKDDNSFLNYILGVHKNTFDLSPAQDDICVDTVIDAYAKTIVAYGVDEEDLYTSYTYNKYDGYYSISYPEIIIVFDYDVDRNAISNVEIIDTNKPDPPDEPEED